MGPVNAPCKRKRKNPTPPKWSPPTPLPLHLCHASHACWLLSLSGSYRLSHHITNLSASLTSPRQSSFFRVHPLAAFTGSKIGTALSTLSTSVRSTDYGVFTTSLIQPRSSLSCQPTVRTYVPCPCSSCQAKSIRTYSIRHLGLESASPLILALPCPLLCYHLPGCVVICINRRLPPCSWSKALVPLSLRGSPSRLLSPTWSRSRTDHSSSIHLCRYCQCPAAISSRRRQAEPTHQPISIRFLNLTSSLFNIPRTNSPGRCLYLQYFWTMDIVNNP